MNGAHERILEQASAWHVASANDDMDWDGFASWLDADPRHRAAYDEIALADARLIELAPQIEPAPPAANDHELDHDNDGSQAGFWGRRAWFGAALAASLVAVLAVPQFLATSPEVYRTSATSRTVALDDGSRIVMAPHSRLEIEIGDQHLALQGGAWFDIKHNPSRTMSIEAGGLTISDVGTSFDVQDAAGHLRVAVGEGSISVSGDALGKSIALTAGKRLHFDPARGTATVATIQTVDAGAWRTGRLNYDSAPLSLVAADLTRYSGVEVVVAKPLRDRTFSGTLIVKDCNSALRDLTQVMGLEFVGNGNAYRIVSPGS